MAFVSLAPRTPHVLDSERTWREVSPFQTDADVARAPGVPFGIAAGFGRAEMSLSEFGRGARFGNWLTDLIPKKTIVGKLLSGDVGGAAAGAAKLVSQGAAKPATPAVKQPATAPGLFAPGGFVEKYQMPLILVAGGLAAWLFFSGRRHR